MIESKSRSEMREVKQNDRRRAWLWWIGCMITLRKKMRQDMVLRWFFEVNLFFEGGSIRWRGDRDRGSRKDSLIISIFSLNLAVQLEQSCIDIWKI